MTKIKGFFKRVWIWIRDLFAGAGALLGRNAVIMFLYALLCTVVCGLTMFSLKSLTLDLAYFLTGTPYVEPDNVFAFFLTPTSIVLLILLGFVIGYAMLFEVSGLLYICKCSREKSRAKLGDVIVSAVTTCNRTAKPKNVPFLLLFILIIPFAKVIPLSVAGVAIGLPEFISDFLYANSFLRVLYIAAIAGFIFLMVSLIFAFPRFVLDGDSFKESIKNSWRLTKKKRIKTYLSFLLVSFGFSALVYVLSIGIFALWAYVKATWGGIPLTGSLISSYSNRMTVTNTVLICIILPQVTCATLSYLYFKYSQDESLPASESVPTFKLSKAKLVVFAAVMVLVVTSTLAVISPTFDTFFEKTPRPIVGAHRGDSLRAPENTMPAFELAIMEKAEMLELDIFQTKDREIVVCHDDNLTRVAGKELYVHEMTLAEIKELDVGSWFSEEFSDVKISTLAEVFETVHDKFGLVQIEIKSTGYEDRIEEQLIGLIDEYDMRDQVVIICLEAEPLQRLKEVDPDIPTAYCMPVAWGDPYTIEFADHISIEESNVEPIVVAEAHKYGKKVYTWTCNTAENVQWLLDCGVDGILTDDPLMVEEALNNCDYSGGFSRFIRIFFTELQNGF